MSIFLYIFSFSALLNSHDMSFKPLDIIAIDIFNKEYQGERNM
jgi:hypothetical protein